MSSVNKNPMACWKRRVNITYRACIIVFDGAHHHFKDNSEQKAAWSHNPFIFFCVDDSSFWDHWNPYEEHLFSTFWFIKPGRSMAISFHALLLAGHNNFTRYRVRVAKTIYPNISNLYIQQSLSHPILCHTEIIPIHLMESNKFCIQFMYKRSMNYRVFYMS